MSEEKYQTEPQQNFFLIIPAHIANDPRIGDSETILFGRIASLSNHKGYCWASDKYLAELSGVSDREIRSRLTILEECGYITKETKKRGMFWDRKIYPNFNYERNAPSASTGSHIPLERITCSEEQYKLKQYNNNTTSPAKKDEKEPPTNDSQNVVVSLSKLNLTDSDKQELQRNHPEKIDLLVKRVLRWKDRKSDTVAMRTILSRWDTWEDTPTEEETQEFEDLKKEELQNKAHERKKLAERIKEKFPDSPFEIKGNMIQVRNERSFTPIGFLEDEIELYLNRYAEKL